MKTHELEKTYKMMLVRCYSPNYSQYKDYGGRGITVCEAWRKSFRQFVIDMGERPTGCTLERADNTKGYSPENCKWATRFEQQRNTRRNHLVKFNGASKPISQWAAEIGISKNTILKRLRSGWSETDALSTPVDIKMRNTKTKLLENPRA